MNTEEMAKKYIEDCQRRALSLRTIEYYEWVFKKLLAQCPDMPTTVEQVAGVIDDPRLGPVSRGNLERGIRAFLTWSQTHHQHPNPLKDVQKRQKVKTLPRVLQEDETAALWWACRNQRERAMLALLLDTGIRLGEIAGLRWADIGPDSLRVDGKTGPRIVPVSRPVREMLTGLGDGTHVWVGRHGPMSRAAVQSSVRRLYGRAGLEGPKRGPHTLRHTFGTHYVAEGGNVVHLQDIMGHESLATTQMYLHLSVSAVQADHAAHSPSQRLLGG